MFNLPFGTGGTVPVSRTVLMILPVSGCKIELC